jgi:hypothetical protein
MKRFSIALSIVFCLLLFACLINKAQAKVVASPPVKVNVVGGTAINDDKIKDVFKEANKVLDQADVSLDNDPNVSHNVDDQGNHDDKIQQNEEEKLDEAGQGEINGKFGNGVGLKVYFTNQIRDDNNILGLAPHVTEDANGKLKGKPMIYVKNDPCLSNKDLGRVLAHEACHVFTVGDKDVYDINDLLKFKFSDANGHVMDINNLMHPAGNEDSNKLTPIQQTEVFNGAARHCKKIKIVKSVSRLIAPTVTTIPQMIGGWIDDMNDVIPPLGYNDLGAGFFYAKYPLDNLEFSILTEGLFPLTPVNMTFSMYLNSDGNLGTGDPAPIPGVDKIIEITVTGEHPGGEVTASIRDTVSGIVTFLPFASTQRIKKIVDHNTTPYSEPYVDGLYLEVPMELMGENNGTIQGLLTSLDFGSGASDNVFFFWEDTSDTDPALTLVTTQINPGDPITVSGKNYAPYSEISIYVDDELISTTFADANGGFIDGPHFDPGSDPFDGGVPADAVVRARDAEGGSDYSILEIVPYDGDINADNAVNFYDVALLANNWLIRVD